jgi:FkbM family methyltransferase
MYPDRRRKRRKSTGGHAVATALSVCYGPAMALQQMTAPAYGALAPSRLDRAVIAVTEKLPVNYLGRRLSILLRRIVTMRLRTGALDVTFWGMRVRLHPLDNVQEKFVLFTPQMYNPVEFAALGSEVDRIVASGRPFVFLDIGANVGLYSLFVAARAKGNARILAVEPEPGNFARLAFNVAANPGVSIRPIQIALGDNEGEIAIELHERDRCRSWTQPLEQASARAVRVACRPLLAVLNEEGIERIDSLKVDVEGTEHAILAAFFRDAPAHLWPHQILLEDNSSHWPIDLFALLHEKGYRQVTRTRPNVVLHLTAKAPEQCC